LLSSATLRKGGKQIGKLPDWSGRECSDPAVTTKASLSTYAFSPRAASPFTLRLAATSCDHNSEQTKSLLLHNHITMAQNSPRPPPINTSDRPQTPSLPTPSGSKTPPTIASKRFISDEGMTAVQRATEAMETDALNRRLRSIESASRDRDRTPGRSPSRKRQRIYGDR
jgi:hypothetical protein